MSGSPNWQADIQETSTFPIIRPGPIAVDGDGNIWVISEAVAFDPAKLVTPSMYAPPLGASYPYPAIISCVNSAGVVQNGKVIDGVVNPTAIFYDAPRNRLLVADNGPDQNIKIYNLTGWTSGAKSSPSATYGAKGGVFSGVTPGSITDSHGSSARFCGPSGVGADGQGNIYVLNTGLQGVSADLRAFHAPATGATTSTELWNVRGLEACTAGDFACSAATGATQDIYTTNKHYAGNWSGTSPGKESTLKSYLWNPLKRGPAHFPYTGSATIYRTIGGARLLFNSGGQGNIGTVTILRIIGEQVLPCGAFWYNGTLGGYQLWIDKNGDGTGSGHDDRPQDPAEVSFLASLWAGPLAYDVDANGNFLIGLGGTGAYPCVLKLNYLGSTSAGVPQYDLASSAHYKNVFNPASGPFQAFTWVGCGLRYDAATDTMYLFGLSNTKNAALTYGGTVACYKNWSTTDWKNKSNKAAWITVLPTPNPAFTPAATNLDFQYYGTGYPSEDGFEYKSFDLANDKIFISEIWGPIHVIDAATGNPIMLINAGPEVSGEGAWEDEAMGIHAHYNPVTNEYDVLDENSAYRARENLFRWSPFSGAPAVAGGIPGDADIGNPAQRGSSTQRAGVFTVLGSGTSNSGEADQAHFCYAKLDGNGSIVAHLASLAATDQQAKAGLIIRSSLDASSPRALIVEAAGGGLYQNFRATLGANTTGTNVSGRFVGTWFKITRSTSTFPGDTFTTFYSQDGVSWTKLGDSAIASMNPTVYVGLDVLSHTRKLATAKFDHVLVVPGGT